MIQVLIILCALYFLWMICRKACAKKVLTHILLASVFGVQLFGLCSPQVAAALSLQDVDTKPIEIISQEYIKIVGQINNTSNMCKEITYIAMSKTGRIAVISGLNEVYVFSDKGDLLYAYSFTTQSLKGRKMLFFDLEDRLCFVCGFAGKPHGYGMFVFEESAGITSCYHLDAWPELDPQLEFQHVDNIGRSRNKDSSYNYEQVTPYSVVIRNRKTNQTVSILNYQEAYDQYQAKLKTHALYYDLFGILLALAVWPLVRWMKRNQHS